VSNIQKPRHQYRPEYVMSHFICVYSQRNITSQIFHRTRTSNYPFFWLTHGVV